MDPNNNADDGDDEDKSSYQYAPSTQPRAPPSQIFDIQYFSPGGVPYSKTDNYDSDDDDDDDDDDEDDDDEDLEVPVEYDWDENDDERKIAAVPRLVTPERLRKNDNDEDIDANLSDEVDRNDDNSDKDDEEGSDKDEDDSDNEDASIVSLNGTTKFRKSPWGGYIARNGQRDSDDEDPEQIEYLVDSLLDVRPTNHHCKKKKKQNGSFEFLVRWTGYDEPTWEPIDNLNREGLQTHIDALLAARGYDLSNDDNYEVDDDEDDVSLEGTEKLLAGKRIRPSFIKDRKQPSKKKRRKTLSNRKTNKVASRSTTKKTPKQPKKQPGQGVLATSVSPMQIATTMTKDDDDDAVPSFIRGSIRVCLADRIFGDRLRKFSDIKFSQPVLPSIHWNGTKMSLLGTKSSDVKGHLTPRTLSAYYVVEEGIDYPKISLSKELQKLANFAAITTANKCASRLELLFTEAGQLPSGGQYRVIENLSPDDFEEINEVHHIGCGFIPRRMLLAFLGTGQVGLLSTAIQVRIIIPKLGLFKGLLQVKNGIDRIQLPSSMKKVGPSTYQDQKELAILVIKAVFPSTQNQYMAKMIEGSALSKSASQSLCQKPLSPMICRVLQEAGVNEDAVEEYGHVIRADVTAIEHANLIGVCDPTHDRAIPAGHVFLTGIANLSKSLKTVVVARFPCTSRFDQRTLPVLKKKPQSMAEEDWSELMGRSFGQIIFGKPQDGHVPIPETIADGDLDGDIYFCTWHKPFLQSVLKHKSDRLATVEDSDTTETATSYNDRWLRDAQNYMSDSTFQRDYSRIIGALYSRWVTLVDERNSATEAFGEAFKRSLEIKKHGGKIYLPGHLWHQIKPAKSLHRFLTTSK